MLCNWLSTRGKYTFTLWSEYFIPSNVLELDSQNETMFQKDWFDEISMCTMQLQIHCWLWIFTSRSLLLIVEVKDSFFPRSDWDHTYLVGLFWHELWNWSKMLFSRFTVGLVLLRRGFDANRHCSWCHYLSCVPTSKWSCNSEPTYCLVLLPSAFSFLRHFLLGFFLQRIFFNISYHTLLNKYSWPIL